MLGRRLIALIRRLPWRLCALCVVLAASSTRGEKLDSAARIRTLTTEEAAKHHPVKLRAVVTFFDEALFSRFIQDDTAGIYLADSTNLPTALTPGQLVEVEGRTDPGQYAPVIVTTKLRVVGQTNLPPAKRVNFEQLASGTQDSQFVEISGIVRAISFAENTKYFAVELTTGGGRIVAYLKKLPTTKSADLVDSTVRVRGVCSTRFTRQRQLFAIRLMVPRAEDMEIEIPAPPDSNSRSRPVGSLLQFTPRGSFGHRVKVAGTVVYFDPGHVLYLEQDGQGLEVQTKQDTPLYIGDQVEVLGFPSQGEYTPMLQDATYQKTSSGPPPSPARITHDDALKGDYDCRLVQITATLVDRAQHSSAPYLILQRNDFIFHAYLGVFQGYEPFADLKNGSTLAVTGICRIEPGEWQAGEAWRAKSFKILLRSLDDVAVLAPAPWWSLQRVLWAAGVLGLITLAASFWVLVLRRKVNQQTQIIRERLNTEAALKERYQDLFENANDIVFTHKFNGEITSINKSGEQLLGQPRKKIVSRNVIDLIFEDQRPAARHWLERIPNAADLPTTEWDFVSADGQRVKLEISSRVIARNGSTAEIESIARDISERRRLERELSEISNREQRRIGHDLHDGVCQQLAAIAYHVDMLGDRLQEKQIPEAKETEVIAQMVKEANTQARGIARGLFPVRLHEHGLVHALQDLAASASKRYQIQCEFHSELNPKFDSEVELHLFFIAQEAMINAVKHGEAKRVAITLSPEKQSWKLVIRDNGKGFASANKSTSGMGLRIMQYRARVIGATLDLQSEPGRGTQVTCLFNVQPIHRTNA